MHIFEILFEGLWGWIKIYAKKCVFFWPKILSKKCTFLRLVSVILKGIYKKSQIFQNLKFYTILEKLSKNEQISVVFLRKRAPKPSDPSAKMDDLSIYHGGLVDHALS